VNNLDAYPSTGLRGTAFGPQLLRCGYTDSLSSPSGRWQAGRPLRKPAFTDMRTDGARSIAAFTLRVVLGIGILLGSGAHITAEEAPYTRTENVIYGRKFGLAMTLDVFQPSVPPNGAGVVFVVSGGWFSARRATQPKYLVELLRRGYTIFAVVHGSQPKFTIPEIVADMHRAVRYVRSRCDEYAVGSERLGIMGASAGGHLSLMQGMAGIAGDPDSEDPVERCSSRVQAVACFFPPTDFLNYGREGENALGRGILAAFAAPFDFKTFDQETKRFERIVDPEKILAIGRQISPVTHVSSDDPPTLIIHGDADRLVPVQQAKLMIDDLQESGVECKLVIKQGARHGWEAMDQDVSMIADWFDQHLRATPKAR